MQSYERREEIELSADTPVGRLSAKGFRVPDLVNLLSLMGIIGILFGGYILYSALASHQEHSLLSSKQFIISLRETSIAQRMQTCILAMPQERRETEYMNPNSFCRQMAGMQ